MVIGLSVLGGAVALWNVAVFSYFCLGNPVLYIKLLLIVHVHSATVVTLHYTHNISSNTQVKVAAVVYVDIFIIRL